MVNQGAMKVWWEGTHKEKWQSVAQILYENISKMGAFLTD